MSDGNTQYYVPKWLRQLIPCPDAVQLELPLDRSIKKTAAHVLVVRISAYLVRPPVAGTRHDEQQEMRAA